jgi:hypothetical protein
MDSAQGTLTRRSGVSESVGFVAWYPSWNGTPAFFEVEGVLSPLDVDEVVTLLSPVRRRIYVCRVLHWRPPGIAVISCCEDAREL